MGCVEGGSRGSCRKTDVGRVKNHAVQKSTEKITGEFKRIAVIFRGKQDRKHGDIQIKWKGKKSKSVQRHPVFRC